MESKIVVDCHNCLRKLRLNASHAGKRIRCPACQAVLRVPGTTESAAETKVPLKPPRLARSSTNPGKKTTLRSSVPDDAWLDDAPQEFGVQDDWDDESNPYAPPKTLTRPQSTAASTRFTVDGKLIRCGPELRLPAICIRTGALSDLTEVTKTLKHSPPWAFFVGGIILALIMQKSCRVSYFVSASEKKRQLIWMLGGVGMVVLGAVCLVLGISFRIPEVLALLGIFMMLGGLVTVVEKQQMLKIKKRDGGSAFWIGGCRPAFFETLSAQSSGRNNTQAWN